jgi:hypothetical protein
MAERNYVQRITGELAARLPDCDPTLISLYALLALEFGLEVDECMVHNAWAVWRNLTDPDHRSLIPFPFLAPEVQRLDTPYAQAIRAAVEADRAATVREHAARSPSPTLAKGC